MGQTSVLHKGKHCHPQLWNTTNRTLNNWKRTISGHEPHTTDTRKIELLMTEMTTMGVPQIILLMKQELRPGT